MYTWVTITFGVLSALGLFVFWGGFVVIYNAQEDYDLYTHQDEQRLKKNAILALIMKVVGIAFVVVGITMISWNTTIDYYDVYNRYQYEIVSVEDARLSSGPFWYGYDQSQKENYYYVYRKVENYTYKIEKLPINKTQLCESSSISPSVWKVKELGWNTEKYIIYLPTNTVHSI